VDLYHGTPITPKRLLAEIAGEHLCVSFYDPRQDAAAHAIARRRAH
jgi:hypothetical protein